jgi:hypothetical protein
MNHTFRKKHIRTILSPALLVFVSLFLFAYKTENIKDPVPGWPKITNETKPWSRWWWMGNAVNPADLHAAMEAYSKAGLGGLEITPIYGVHGYEDKFIKFLSPQWVDQLMYTLQEGQRLHLGIDLAMASGWPFGGLWVTPDDACKYMSVQKYALKEGERLKQKVSLIQTPMLRTISKSKLDISTLKYPVSANADSLQKWAIEQIRYPVPMPLQTLMAYSDKGETLDLTEKVQPDGELNWIAPPGNWNLYAVFQGWHGKMVERAGPGGEGDVIDHFSPTAIDHYLEHFSLALRNKDLSGLRAYFNDSYEVDDARGQADFTPLLFDEFQKRRGYDLRNYLPALMGDDKDEINRRVLCDYRETISDLILDHYTRRWHDWANKAGKIIRNQVHGAPANILDLYAAADIPEAEDQDLVKVKMASSAAHVTGKKLASSESATWLKDHFEASLADVKQAIDLFFLGGINHVFYHGTPFSPQNAPWPGWLFYAAVHFGPTNTFWNDFGTLNTYIARSQSFLQSGKPNNDILLYYPISDEYAVRGRALLLHFNGSSKGSSFRESAEFLLQKGYAFDDVSDRQVLNINSESGQILSGETSYQTLLVPHVKLMPPETFEKIVNLAKNGATILMEELPEDVPGMDKLGERQARFHAILNEIKFQSSSANVKEANMGKGRILAGKLPDLLAKGKIRRETMFDLDLQCVRRVEGNVTTYFIANRGKVPFDGMAPLETKIRSAVLYNPMNGSFGKAVTKISEATSEVLLQLSPGESCLVQVFQKNVNVPEYNYLKALGEKEPLGAGWLLTFVNGGPVIPPPAKLQSLRSWTELDDDCYKAFSGTAVYKTTFAKPPVQASYYRLDLGKVAFSARVSLNGKELATLVSSPFSVAIPGNILKDQNTLEISVTNLMGNRIADMEHRGEKYKVFYNVNFPSLLAQNRGADGLFTTTGWLPQESGLIGPVTLQALALY